MYLATLHEYNEYNNHVCIKEELRSSIYEIHKECGKECSYSYCAHEYNMYKIIIYIATTFRLREACISKKRFNIILDEMLKKHKVLRECKKICKKHKHVLKHSIDIYNKRILAAPVITSDVVDLLVSEWLEDNYENILPLICH